MKKPYQSPLVAVEVFAQTQHSSSCSGININLTDTACVLMDPDSTVGMLDIALLGGFLNADSCALSVIDHDMEDDEICYHTSVFMAFTS